MKAPIYALAALVLALGTVSCTTTVEKVYTASGYNMATAYQLGHRHGSSDRLAGKAHNPHINRPSQTPGAYRNEYLWGYTEGYKAPCTGVSGSK